MSAIMPAAARKVFHDGLAPLLSVRQLERLRQALVTDTPTLIQGATCDPPPLMVNAQSPILGLCLVSYCGWDEDGLETVEQAEEYFGRLCYEIDGGIGGPAECRWLLNWFDDTPRAEMRRLLLIEVEAVLAGRQDTLPVGRAG